MKPKLYVHVRQAAHFLRWERAHFERHFELVAQPAPDVVTFAFGPDVLDSAARLPALRRVVLLLPGYGCDPYHDLAYRNRVLATVDRSYDLLFVNPGPLEVAYGSCARLAVCPFSVDVDRLDCRGFRQRIDSLLHVSADFPQKDWRRSQRVMELTGLRHEVVPARKGRPHSLSVRVRYRFNGIASRLGLKRPFALPPAGYLDHMSVIRKYQGHDAFVHVAAEVPAAPDVDGKYTACLIEAGVTGAILFWHDTLGLGNDLETVFSVPLDPGLAAERILEVRRSIDVEAHSRRTRQEMRDRFDPARSVALRARRIMELL